MWNAPERGGMAIIADADKRFSWSSGIIIWEDYSEFSMSMSDEYIKVDFVLHEIVSHRSRYC